MHARRSQVHLTPITHTAPLNIQEVDPADGALIWRRYYCTQRGAELALWSCPEAVGKTAPTRIISLAACTVAVRAGAAAVQRAGILECRRRHAFRIAGVQDSGGPIYVCPDTDADGAAWERTMNAAAADHAAWERLLPA